MSSTVTYPNLRSRILLKRVYENQYVVPPELPRLAERLLKWYERRLMDVDTSHIQVDRPIFLVGLPRSGTTIVQDILCAHPRVAYITNSMHRFRTCFLASEDIRKRLRLDLKGERYLRDGLEIEASSPNEGHAFFADWLGYDLYSWNYVNWQMEEIAPEKIASGKQTIRKIIWSFGDPPRRFFNKNPGLVVHMLLLKDIFPDAKIVHIVRDARLCANSMIKLYRRNRAQELKVRANLRRGYRGNGVFVPYPRMPKLAEYMQEYGPEDLRTTANLWNDVISFVGEKRSEMPNFYELRYEDLVANPEQEVRKLTDFCELDEVPDRSSRFWQKVGEIRDVGRSKNYGDFELVESICRENLRRYGYL